jgi:peptidoglycan/LPS O-acetylase OafA/YrhL
MENHQEAKFLSLEGLRGLLALLVCGGHLGLNTIVSKVGLTVHFGLAVDVFFALSGFVLCHSNYFGRRNFKRFIIGRFARLYPLHLLTLLAMALMYPALGNSLSVIELFEQLTALHNVGLPPHRLTLNFPSWSISVEIWISILFFLLLQSKRLRFRLPLLICAVITPALLFPSYIIGDVGNASSFLNFGLLRGVAGFSAGAIAFLLFDRYSARFTCAPAVVYILLFILAGFFLLEAWAYALPILFYAILVTVLVLLAANDDATILCSPPTVFLGMISYSIYLLHIPIYSALSLAFGEQHVRGPAKVFVFLAILIGSWISYKLIERPAQLIILDLSKAQSRKV